MNKLVINCELGVTLSELTDRSEFVNEKGDFLGLFLPAQFRGLPIFQNITDEEIKRRCQSSGGTTLAEIWKSLEAFD